MKCIKSEWYYRSRLLSPALFLAVLLGCSSVSLAQLSTLPELAIQETPITPSALAPERYSLDAGDRIYIEVFNVPDYSREYQVLTDGTISMPLIGAVPMRGVTLAQAGDVLNDRYRRFIHAPAISVELIAARPMQIAIAGEINRPGVYTIPPDVDPSTVTVTEVIQMAGGITQSANIQNVEVHSPHAQPQNSLKKANLWALVTKGDITQDLQLQDGDTIFLSTASTNIAPLEAQTLASASFSADEIIVNVVGEVNSPGAIPVPPNTPLNQALLAAGGFNDDANQRSVELIRLNPNGTVSQQTIDIDFSQGVNIAANPPLRPNDTIVVNDSGLATFSRTIDSVLSPITGIFKIFRLFGF
ncbi:MAG: SLBB domain-containing protein [Leptolyngbyaceae cyanobacterium MAG.088]|nr:SLBB domain-containing protein [Leptolyngbyaceae cyanobacterium MAG.088]